MSRVTGVSSCLAASIVALIVIEIVLSLVRPH
jgi:hypothetical protein